MKTDNKILSTIYWALVFQGGYLIAATAVNSFQEGKFTLYGAALKEFIIALTISSLYHWWVARKEKAKSDHP